MISKTRRVARGAVLLSLLLCPLSFASLTARRSAYAQGPIEFTPHITPLIIEETPGPFEIGTVGSPGPVATTTAPVQLPYVSGNMLIVEGQSFPIGDEFLDASGIPLGPVEQDYLGTYGWAAVAGQPDYVLLWYVDWDGQKHHIITQVSDPLFVGHPGIDDGFEDYLRELKKAEDAMAISGGGVFGGVGTLVLIELGLCVPTAGTTCGTAFLTAVVGGIGGGATYLYNHFFKYVPAGNNLEKQFEQIDAVRP